MYALGAMFFAETTSHSDFVSERLLLLVAWMQTALSVPPHHWMMTSNELFPSLDVCSSSKGKRRSQLTMCQYRRHGKQGKLAISFEKTLFMIVLELLLGG